MTLQQASISLSSSNDFALINITPQVLETIQNNNWKDGLLNIITKHTTATVSINEECKALESDVKNFLQNLVPAKKDYEHNKVCVDDRPNAHSHILGYLTSNTITLPIVNGELGLGKWQQVFFVELDGPRETREVVLSFVS